MKIKSGMVEIRQDRSGKSYCLLGGQDIFWTLHELDGRIITISVEEPEEENVKSQDNPNL